MTAAAVPAFLHDLRVGQAVWHAKFESGVVLAKRGSGFDERVLVKFVTELHPRWLAVHVARLTGSPQLAADPSTNTMPLRDDDDAGPGPTWRPRRRSPLFVEWCRPQVLTLPQCAARAAACLRALAAALAVREPGEAWVDVSWLLPLRAIGLGAPQTWNRLCEHHGRPDPALPGRYRRTSVRTAHYLQTRAEGPPWVMFRAPQRTPPPLEWELRRLANCRTDMRVGLGAASAPVLMHAAEGLEQEFDLAPQPALWCQRRTGALNGTAFDVAHGFWDMWVAWRVAAGHPVWSAGPFDLLDLSVTEQDCLPYREANVLNRLHWMMRRSARAGTLWRGAQVELVTSSGEGRTACIGVTLHAARPFGLVRHWFTFNATPRRTFALPLHLWPDATFAMGGVD